MEGKLEEIKKEQKEIQIAECILTKNSKPKPNYINKQRMR
jgi:hypothetical protein